MKSKLISLALALVMCLGLAIPAGAAAPAPFDWDGAAEVKNYEEFAAALEDGKVEKIKIVGEVIVPQTDNPIRVRTPVLVAEEGKLSMAPDAVMFVHVPMGQFNFENAQQTWDLVAEMCETFIMWHPDEDTFNRDIFGTQPDINEQVKNAGGEPIEVLVVSGGDMTLTEDLTVGASFQIFGHDLTIGKGVKVEAGVLHVQGNLTMEEGASLTLNAEGSKVGGNVVCADKSQVPEDLEVAGEIKTPGEDPAPETPAAPKFADVTADSPFAAAIGWAVEQGITNGVSETSFAPGSTCTRAQIITFLWRSVGKPAPKSAESPFTDVTSGAMNADFYNAILWAGEQEMVKEDTFRPNDPCTRAMAVDFIWKAAVKDENQEIATPSFTDVTADSPYRDAIAWAVANRITMGTGDGTTFSPGASCTRGQIVTFLYRTAQTPAPLDE